jgi:hypothetical protein
VRGHRRVWLTKDGQGLVAVEGTASWQRLTQELRTGIL